jgi:hypothetical protein
MARSAQFLASTEMKCESSQENETLEGDSNDETVKAEMKQVAKIISARRF